MFKVISFFALCFSITNVWGLDAMDKASIQAIIERYTECWNQYRCHGFANDFTEDADFVNIFGMAFSGKEEIEARHVKILQTFLKDSHLQVMDIRLREVLSGVVIGLIPWQLDGFRNPVPGSEKETKRGIFTQVFVKNGDL
jgi:hypothetical protein